MVEVRWGGSINSPDTTQEMADRVNEIVGPMAEVLLNCTPQESFNVTGSLMITYALQWDDPIRALRHLAETILDRMPEAMEQYSLIRH